MKNRQILKVFLLGAIAICGILGFQAYWVVSTWNINDREFSQKVNYALYRVASSLAELEGVDPPIRNIVKKQQSNYYIVNINSDIDAAVLEHFLQKELESLGLNVDFEYGIYDCSSDQMMYGDYISYTPEKRRAERQEALSKYNEFVYYFGVRFPNRSGFLLGKMQLSIFFTSILLLTVAFFAYSVYVILKQKRLSEMQKDFINNMTHEFKTPLSTIKISADVFLNNPLIQSDSRLHRYAGIIKEQNTRLNNQVERVLQIARFEQGNFKLHKEFIPLREILEQVQQTEQLQLSGRGGQLQLHMQCPAVEIEADRFHFTNILYSLIDNSVKYCKTEPRIELRTFMEDNSCTLQIKDNGIGIAKEHQSKVFDKFYRVPTGNVHDVKGFGLGLYYVHKICQAHQWKIDLNSEPGKGTTFEICIPMKKN